MKKKSYKIFGVGLVVMLAASLLMFAAPVSAQVFEPAKPNMWDCCDEPDEGFLGGWFFDPEITRVGPIAEAINGDLYAYVEDASVMKEPNPNWPECDIFKSTDEGRTWSTSIAPKRYSGGRVVDMVCSSIDENVVYATDGFYVFKSIDGGQNWDCVAQESLEELLGGGCGCDLYNCAYSYWGSSAFITSIDVTYDANDNPFVFIGTKAHYVDEGGVCAECDDFGGGHPEVPGSVYYINEGGYPITWVDLDLSCFVPSGGTSYPLSYEALAVGCAPDWATTKTTYALISSGHDSRSMVVSTTGITCSWNQVGELFYDCDVSNPFRTIHASRFAFPTDFADTSTMFIGVTSNSDGGDVYRVVDSSPPTEVLDLNVQGYTTGCVGKDHANICSLDMEGSTDDGSLMAGAYDQYEEQSGTEVYYSNDGGWTWAESKKDPAGRGRTYVLLYDDTAVAGTRYCGCGFFMSCGEEVGEFWNGISLQNMDIDYVLDLSHAPGYVDGNSTMFMLTYDEDACQGPSVQTTNLLRWDGTYWERVHWSYVYAPVPDTWFNTPMDWVEVSPDFNTTGCVYLANTAFQMERSIDTGCSWAPLSYPCEEITITAWIVVDEETVLTSGTPASGPLSAYTVIYKTTRHGTRPWDAFPIKTAIQYDGVDFDLSPSIASDMSVLFGDMGGQVFISENVGSTWDQIQNLDLAICNVLPSANTYVQFDPGYGTSGDQGENMIYAAAGEIIARCDINPDAPWVAQCWDEIYDGLCEASGIDAQGDTALYVSDKDCTGAAGGVTVDGTIEVECLSGYGYSNCACDVYDLDITAAEVTGIVGDGFIDDEIVTVIDWDLVCTLEDYTEGPDICYCSVVGEVAVRGVTSNTTGTIEIDEYVAASCSVPPDPLPVTTCGVGWVFSSHLTATTAAGTGAIIGGVVRSLNPMDPLYPVVPFDMVEWERLTFGPMLEHDTSTTWTDDLWLTTKGMSNMLWVLDSEQDTSVCVWEDALANPVLLESPACGVELVTPDRATLEWAALDAAKEYEIELYQYCPQCPDEKLKIKDPVTEENFTSKDTCLIMEGLAAGTEHYWRVRAIDPYLSKWSELCTFTTALGTIPYLCSPPCGGKDVILTTNFSWDAIFGAASYELQIVEAGADGTADFTGATTLTTDVNAMASIPGLEYGTTYYWRVRAISATGVPGAWAVCIFTTMYEPEEVVPPEYQVVEIPAEEVITPTWIWVLIGIGAALTIAVVILIVTTRRVP